MNLTKYDIAILLGLLLGNGHIDSKGQIHIKHSKKQKEYCEFKAKLVHSICGGSNIKIKESIDGTNKFKKQSKRFQQIRKLLYSENKKTINTRTSYRIIGSDYSAQEPRQYDNFFVIRCENVRSI